MRSIELGTSGQEVPNIIAGMMRIGDKTDVQIRDLYAATREAGVNYFDHADLYGFNVPDGGYHFCERRFAEALKISPAEREDIIAGYTVVYGDKVTEHQIEALISVSVAPSDHEEFLMLADHQLGVARCYHVTGSYSFILCVACSGIAELESLINRFQKFGATSSQIILSTSVDRSAGIL